MTDLPHVSVIIVNFNGGNFPKEALESLASQTFRDFEVLFVDNASSDGSADGLPSKNVPGFQLLKQDENLGFAGGNNLGARLARGQWIALLNPDAIASHDWLEKLVEATENYPSVPMFASAQISARNADIIDGAGDAYLLWGMPWRGGYGRPMSDMPVVEGTCFSPCGAGAFFHRATFLDHGGFDERFFCFCEDVDIGFRLRLSGHECVFLPQAIVRHYGGHSSDKVSDFAAYHGARNRIWTYSKNMPWLLLLVTLPMHILLSVFLILKALVQGKLAATLKGMWDGIAGVAKVRSSRDHARKASLWSLSRAMAWNPLVMYGRHVHVRRIRND